MTLGRSFPSNIAVLTTRLLTGFGSRRQENAPRSRPMTIGVWIEMPPKGQLVGEGIGQLVRMIVEGARDEEVRWEFLAPFWARDMMLAYLREFDGPVRRRVGLVTTTRFDPLARMVAKELPRAGVRAHIPRLPIESLRRILRRAAKRIVARPTPFVLALTVASPLLLVLAPVLLIPFLLGRRFLPALVRLGRKPLDWMRTRHAASARTLFLEEEYERMATYANRRRDIDCWLVPNPAWAAASAIAGPKVALFPDFVFAEHLTGFSAKGMQLAKGNFAKLAASGTAYVAFSEHVRREHARRIFRIPESRLFLIRHAPVDNPQTSATYSRAAAQQLLDVYQRKTFARENAKTEFERVHIYPYLRTFDLSNIRYIFVSTQHRPYKNVLRLVEAAAILLRKHHVEIKIVTTGKLDFAVPGPLEAFLLQEGLWFDILSVPRVPKKVHQALYACASLTVHPSFFEGGFPFVFAESLSMGTPCLLARSSATVEGLAGFDSSQFTFDPYISPEDLAETIKHALNCRSELLDRQLEILQAMRRRTWSDVSREYVQVFEEVSRRNLISKPYRHSEAAEVNSRAMSHMSRS